MDPGEAAEAGCAAAAVAGGASAAAAHNGSRRASGIALGNGGSGGGGGVHRRSSERLRQRRESTALCREGRTPTDARCLSATAALLLRQRAAEKFLFIKFPRGDLRKCEGHLRSGRGHAATQLSHENSWRAVLKWCN